MHLLGARGISKPMSATCMNMEGQYLIYNCIFVEFLILIYTTHLYIIKSDYRSKWPVISSAPNAQ
jgi:hypothetical protein